MHSHHGAGGTPWPNLLIDRLPDGARSADGIEDVDIGLHVDAMFQVGAHARGGRPSFLSHTTTPGLRLRVGDELLSESHLWAWAAAIPVLGMVGSLDLGETRGSLDDVPFLAVQRSVDRAHARPVFSDPARTSAEIRAFAAAAGRDATRRRDPSPSGPVRLVASLQNGREAATDMTAAGWTRLDHTTYAIERASWRSDDAAIVQAIDAAGDAAWVPYAAWFDGLDPTSEETAMAAPAERRAWWDAMAHAWAADDPPEWFDPDAVDARWEGLEGSH